MKNVRNTAKSLRDAIDAFRTKLPFLKAFSPHSVLQRHWDTLFERMGGKKPKTADISKITMQEMLDIGVLEFLEDFEEISSAANKENNLKRALGQMKLDWEPIMLTLKTYKNTGVPLLTAIDEIQAYLDDYIVKTQAIRSSPFCKPFEEEVHAWEVRNKLCEVWSSTRLINLNLKSCNRLIFIYWTGAFLFLTENSFKFL